jgi:hypothetical protein
MLTNIMKAPRLRGKILVRQATVQSSQESRLAADPAFLTPPDLAEHWQISERQVRRFFASGCGAQNGCPRLGG